jgi:hypothetical protein
MNAHLTSQQISECVLGEGSREAEFHVRECSLCQADLSQFEASLKGFRDSVRQWSEQQIPPSLPQARRNPAQSWIMGLCWAMAAIALCIFIGRLSYRPVPPPKTAATANADAALLAQIDHEVSRTVPDSMEPLTQLVSWDASSSASTGGKITPESQSQ